MCKMRCYYDRISVRDPQTLDSGQVPYLCISQPPKNYLGYSRYSVSPCQFQNEVGSFYQKKEGSAWVWISLNQQTNLRITDMLTILSLLIQKHGTRMSLFFTLTILKLFVYVMCLNLLIYLQGKIEKSLTSLNIFSFCQTKVNLLR